MKIETKYDLGQLVWYLKDNKIHSAPVLSILIVKNKHRADPLCPFGDEKCVYATIHIHSLKEEDIFSSKEELLKSL